MLTLHDRTDIVLDVLGTGRELVALAHGQKDRRYESIVLLRNVGGDSLHVARVLYPDGESPSMLFLIPHFCGTEPVNTFDRFTLEASLIV